MTRARGARPTACSHDQPERAARDAFLIGTQSTSPTASAAARTRPRCISPTCRADRYWSTPMTPILVCRMIGRSSPISVISQVGRRVSDDVNPLWRPLIEASERATKTAIADDRPVHELLRKWQGPVFLAGIAPPHRCRASNNWRPSPFESGPGALKTHGYWARIGPGSDVINYSRCPD
jgi:hypothetical protein